MYINHQLYALATSWCVNYISFKMANLTWAPCRLSFNYDHCMHACKLKYSHILSCSTAGPEAYLCKQFWDLVVTYKENTTAFQWNAMHAAGPSVLLESLVTKMGNMQTLWCLLFIFLSAVTLASIAFEVPNPLNGTLIHFVLMLKDEDGRDRISES